MNSIPSYNDNADQELKNLVGVNSGLTVPEVYFEELPRSIKLQVGEISETDLSIIKKEAYPFGAPINYFESLQSRIQSNIEQAENFEANPLIPTNETGFDIPDDYFEQSKFNILDETSEHKNIIGETKENAFAVEESYFEKSKKHILAQTAGHKKETKQIPRKNIFQLTTYKTILRYAAVVAVAFGLGYFSNNKQNIVVYNNHGQLSKPVIIEDITYEELQAALFEEDLSNEDLIELANIQESSPSKNNIITKDTIPMAIGTKNSNPKKKDYIPTPDKTPTQQQIEQYIIDNTDNINPDEL